MKTYLTILLFLLLVPVIGFAATNDFVASANITVAGVVGDITADMLILDGSTAESWTFNSGAFTVTNPGSAFKVGSSNSSVKSMKISSGGSVLVCAENTTPGTSYATLPTSSGTYTVTPSTTSDCTTLCTTLSNTASYNSYPGCGAASCNAGYRLSGSGSSATCVPIGGGGIIAPTPTPTLKAPSVAQPSPVAQIVSPVFNKALRYGVTSADVTRLQQLLTQDPEVYPEGIVSGWFGQLTRKAVQKFQAKYGIVSSGDENTTGYGALGPKTRAKIQDVFGGQPSTTTPVSPPSTQTTEQIQAKIQEILEKIKLLQEQLNTLQ